jgi:hypothetical protein
MMCLGPTEGALARPQVDQAVEPGVPSLAPAAAQKPKLQVGRIIEVLVQNPQTLGNSYMGRLPAWWG